MRREASQPILRRIEPREKRKPFASRSPSMTPKRIITTTRWISVGLLLLALASASQQTPMAPQQEAGAPVISAASEPSTANQERVQLDGECAAKATCRQRNRRLELDAGLDKSSCYCDEKCVLYDDCCRDSRFTESFGARVASADADGMRQRRAQWHCYRINSVFGDVLVKSQCSPLWLESDELKKSPAKLAAAETIKRKCEYFKQSSSSENTAQDPIGMMMPITDVTDGITYANMYCLRCNKLTFGSRTRANKTESQTAAPPAVINPEATLNTEAIGQIQDKNRRDLWTYWRAMLECNYDIDKDDRDALIDLISASKGQALQYLRERNKWVIRQDYVAAALTTTTQSPTVSGASPNASDVVRECKITPTIPESIEHLIRFCRKNTIDTCAPAAELGDAASAETSISPEEMERARLECRFGHQSLVYAQNSRKVYFNLACAHCNNDRRVSCRPRARKADSAELSSGNGTSMSPADDSQPEASARNTNFRGSMSGSSSMGSFSLIFDLNGEGQIGAKQTCNRNQVYDPFFNICRCLICGLNLRYLDGKCVPAKARPFDSPPTSKPPVGSASFSVTLNATAGSPLGDLISMLVDPIVGGGGGTGASSRIERTAPLNSSGHSAGQEESMAAVSPNATIQHRHSEGSHLDGPRVASGATTEATIATAQTAAREMRVSEATGKTDAAATSGASESSKSAKLELTVAPTSPSPNAAKNDQLPSTTTIAGSMGGDNSDKSPTTTVASVAPETTTTTDDPDLQDISSLDMKFDIILSQMNANELPQPTPDSRRLFADCVKIAIPAKHYRLFTMIVLEGDPAAGSPPEVKLVDLERQTAYWRRQQKESANRNSSQSARPPATGGASVRVSRPIKSLEGNKLWAFIEAYNMTLPSSLFELVRARNSRSRPKSAAAQQQRPRQEFDLSICSPFGTDFSPKFNPWMVYVTNVCLVVSITSLSAYLLLYGLSMLELRHLLVEMLQSGKDVANGAFASFRDRLQAGRSNSLSTAHRSQSLPSRGVACLAISLLVAYLLFIFGHQFQAPKDSCSYSSSCALVAVATYFCFLVSFNWMFILSYDIWRTLKLATCHLKAPALHSQSKRFASYVIFALGAAALVAGSAVLVDQMEPFECAQTMNLVQRSEAQANVDAITCGKMDLNSFYAVAPKRMPQKCSLATLKFNEFLRTYKPKFGQLTGSCWFSNRKGLALFFGAPVSIIMLLNLLFFIHSSYMVIKTSVATNNSAAAADDKKDYRRNSSSMASHSQSAPSPNSQPSWIPISNCDGCDTEKPVKPKIKCQVTRANSSASSSNQSTATDYTQQNSLTAMSVNTVQSHLSSISSSSSSLKSEDSHAGDAHETGGHLVDVSPPSTPPVLLPPGAIVHEHDQHQNEAQEHEESTEQQAPEGKLKKKLESRSKSASSIGSAGSKHSSSIAASLAMKYDASYSNLSAFMSTIVKDYRLYCRLSTIMGLTWLMGLIASLVNNNDCLWYIFVVLNTLQGLFIFIAFGCKKSKLINAEILLSYLQFKWISRFGGGRKPNTETEKQPGESH